MVKNILVIGGTPKIDWKAVFAGEKLHGEEAIRVERAHWDDIVLVSYSDAGPIVNITTKGAPVIGYAPHFLVVRSACRGIYQQDWRNILYGFMYCKLPSVNTLESLYWCQEKPLIYSRLNAIANKVGRENFPLISQTYYANWRAMSFHTGVPLVAKLGTCHSGFGKMRIQSDSDFDDFRSVAALQPLYITAEPFINWDYDIRIQKIGHHYRAFRRVSANWKGKGANQSDEDIEVTPRYRAWVDLACEEFGMDVCAIDAVHSKDDGKEYILEMNDSAIGFNIRHEEEDLQHLRDLVLARMMQAYPLEKKPDPSQQVPVESAPIPKASVDSAPVEINPHGEAKPFDNFSELSPQEQNLQLQIQINRLKEENSSLRALLDESKRPKKTWFNF